MDDDGVFVYGSRQDAEVRRQKQLDSIQEIIAWDTYAKAWCRGMYVIRLRAIYETRICVICGGELMQHLDCGSFNVELSPRVYEQGSRAICSLCFRTWPMDLVVLELVKKMMLMQELFDRELLKGAGKLSLLMFVASEQ